MRHFTSVFFVFFVFFVFLMPVVGVPTTGCSGADGDQDGGLPPDIAPRPYGHPCEVDSDCATRECLEYVANFSKGTKKKVCTKSCRRLRDCVSVLGRGFDCGEVEPKKLRCYPRTYDTREFHQGYDCSLDSKCVGGYLCTGQVGDADRYCASPCKTDMDCPPRYRCATTRTGKDLDKEQRCLLRQICHPCAIDEQCGGPDDLCVKDSNGNHYCSMACTKTGTTCPGYAKCEDAGNHKLQCRHKAGYCFKSFKKEGGLCDPCIVHGWVDRNVKNKFTQVTTIAEEGACKDGTFCQLLDLYTGDAGCIIPCTNDACPSSDYECWDKIENTGIGLPKDSFYFPIFGQRMCSPRSASGNLQGCFVN